MISGFPNFLKTALIFFTLITRLYLSRLLLVMVISTKYDPFPDLTLIMVYLSIVGILPNFWVCGLQISSPGAFMLTLFVRNPKNYWLYPQIVPISSLRHPSYPLPQSCSSYGSDTFHPLNSTLTKQLEATQRFAYRGIL